MPSRLNAFLTKELNVWTQAASRWISPERWQACNLGPVEETALAGRPCWGGLDLSSTLDVTALAWVFPQPDGQPTDVLMRMWIPEENWERRVREERAPYDVWIGQGLLTLTPGNVVDYDFILHQVEQDVTLFQVQELAFDPWNATSVTNKIGLAPEKLVEFRQGYVSMNPAMKALEVAIQRRAINHGGHAGLAWMADNLTASYDPAGNAKPDKSKSTEKIDGMVALIMAHYRSSLASGPGESVYERRGLRVL
jgi:phage terminase large subunit-like protein